MIYPLVEYAHRSCGLYLSAHGILGQHHHILLRDETVNPVIDLRIYMIRPSGKDDPFLSVLSHIFYCVVSGLCHAPLVRFLSCPSRCKRMLYLKHVRSDIEKRVFALVFSEPVALYDVLSRIVVNGA